MPIGPRLDAELAMDARLREMVHAEDDFILVELGPSLPGHEDRLTLLKPSGRIGRRFVDAVDPAKEPARVVLSRLIESFSRLCTILQRLQDEGIAHIAICPDAIVFDSAARSVRLARFCNAVSMVSPCSALKEQASAYSSDLAKSRHIAPEARALLALVHTSKERVSVEDLAGVLEGNELSTMPGLIGQETHAARSRLEGGWKGWDVYALTRMYTELLESIVSWRLARPGAGKPRNPWLDGVLTELRKGWDEAGAGGTRPSLVKIKRGVERAWYEGGDVLSCQQIVDDMNSKRVRSLRIEDGGGDRTGAHSA